MAKEQSNTKERTRFQEPRKFDVVIHNDDFTPMDLVVMIIAEVFFKPIDEATALMLKVHNSEKAVVGTYTLDIATSKKNRAEKTAREYGFPLRLTVEPAEAPF